MAFLVTGAHHRAVCALYERQLEQQRADFKDDVAVTLERAENAEKQVAELHAKVLEMMAPRETKVADGPRMVRRRPAGDGANFDPADPKQLFTQAVSETGSRNAARIQQRMQQIRDRAPKPHRVHSMPTPSQDDVQRMISDAEFEGLTMAEMPTGA